MQPSTLHGAEDAAAAKAEIHRIKLDESYLYGEGRNEDANSAYDYALTDLLTTVNEVRESQGKSQLKRRDIEHIATEVATSDNRGRHVCLLYLTRDKALSLQPKGAPMTDIPGRPEKKPSAKPAPKTVEKPKPAPRPAVSQNDDMLRILCAMNTWTELKPILTEYKNLGKIAETKPTMNPADVPGDAYAIIFDEVGGVLAILSPRDNAPRIDCRTGREDNESKHSNLKFIVWYR